jgi:hypothetical protein
MVTYTGKIAALNTSEYVYSDIPFLNNVTLCVRHKHKQRKAIQPYMCMTGIHVRLVACRNYDVNLPQIKYVHLS